MKDLGEVMKQEASPYNTVAQPPHEPKKIYPSVNLPLKVMDKSDLELGAEVTLTLKGKITRLEKSKWSQDVTIEVHSGEGKSGGDDSAEE